MIWGAGSVTTATLSQVRREGRVLLGFNEPDLSSQSNMSVSQALALWPRLMATGMRLGSPAVARSPLTEEAHLWSSFLAQLPDTLPPELFEARLFLGRGADAVALADTRARKQQAMDCCALSPRLADVRPGWSWRGTSRSPGRSGSWPSAPPACSSTRRGSPMR
jgi:Glycosyl hydrolase catalytic core